MFKSRVAATLAAITLPLGAALAAVPAATAQAVGPSGIQICNSINSDFGFIQPHYHDYQGDHWGNLLWPGDCQDFWNGSDPGPLRVRLDTGVNSFYIKEYRTGRLSPCDSSPIVGVYKDWNPADSNNGYRVDVDISDQNNCS